LAFVWPQIAKTKKQTFGAAGECEDEHILQRE
jgi:hypothetical protein